MPASSDSFLVVVSNLPRKLQHWRAFKDLIRDMINGQPGWTYTHKSHGLTTLKDTNDAYAAFEALSQSAESGQTDGYGRHGPILVHLYLLTNGEEPQLFRCTCSKLINDANMHMDLQSRTVRLLDLAKRKDDDPVAELTLQTSQLHLPEEISYEAQSYYTNPFTSPIPASDSVEPWTYMTNPDGIQVNVSYGVTEGTRRTVHISNMPRKATKNKLLDELQKLGIENFKVTQFKEHVSGGPRPSALLLFESKTVATDIAELLDGYEWGHNALVAKLAKELAEEEERWPPVVNGSTW